jgi:hypothetical protein
MVSSLRRGIPPSIALLLAHLSFLHTRSKSHHLVRRSGRLARPVLLVLAFAATLRLSGLGLAVGHKAGILYVAHPQPHQLRLVDEGSTRDTILTVEPTRLRNRFAIGTVGLSIETSTLATQDVSSGHKSLIELLKLLGPGVLRIGGGTLDYSWWTSDDESPPAWATSVITPADLTHLRELLDATNWRVILGVDFGHLDAARAANEAHAAHDILGSRLLGIEIGNEPNGYKIPSINLRDSTYNVTSYLEELSTYSTSIHAVLPSMHLYGPDLSAPNSWIATIAVDPQLPLSVLTEHYYPTTYSISGAGCEPTALPTALNLLSPQVRQEENTLLEALVSAGRLAHRSTRISETNTTASCDSSGGPDTGPVFASALWSLDWALRTASAGVEGINFHGTLGPCVPVSFSPLCGPNGSVKGEQAFPRPEYYGILAARQLEGGRFVPVHINSPSISANLVAYATVHAKGIVTLAVDNFATDRTSFILKVPGYDSGTDETLIGPSINATSGVTFGHASFNPANGLHPRQAKIYRARDLYRLTIPPMSAVVITLHR